MGFLRNLFGTSQPAPELPMHPDDKELVTDNDRQWYEIESASSMNPLVRKYIRAEKE